MGKQQKTKTNPILTSRERCGIWLPLLLFASVCLVYAPVFEFDFINFDDDAYVFQNPFLRAGLNSESIRFAFTSIKYFYWQPLTWLSHAADIELFGLKAGPAHVENVLLHALSSALLFWFLGRATGSVWRSAVAAGVFALHPFRVESVAWVAERKDVLVGLFWMLGLLSYAQYSIRPSRKRYVLVLAAMAGGAMAKPSIVTLPFVLLILDWWPLKRAGSWHRLVIEKLPLFTISILSSLVTYIGQRQMGATVLTDQIPAAVRFANAVVSYGWYLGHFVWPQNLTILYPYEREVPEGAIVFSALVLIAITVLAWARRRTEPYLLAGWLWFLGVLFPVIGFVQAGSQARADRFTYIPSIGLTIACVWAMAELLGRWPARLRWAVSIGVLVVLAAASMAQTAYWRNGVAAFTRAVEVTKNNPVAQHNLGFALAAEGRHGEALPHYLEALRLHPKHAEGNYNLGRSLWSLGRNHEAQVSFAKALEERPNYAEAHYALATLQLREGNDAAARIHFEQSLKLGLAAEYASQAHNDLGVVLARRNEFAAAAAHFRAALQLNPAFTMAQKNLEGAVAAQGRP
jgi:tetratricopeptide (TPR) repeat protein